MIRQSSFRRLAPLAEDQWGFVTRRQAEKAGLAPATIARLAHGGDLERVAHGVYHLRGAPQPSHADLRAAWLQLAPDVPAWERTPQDGVVSHRSAAALYGIGHLPADVHEFTFPARRQSRRSDVRLHIRPLGGVKWITLDGLLTTRPSRIASDLLRENEDPEAVAQLIADAIREVYDYPGTFADSLAPHAARFSLRSGDGLALLRWFLGLVGDPGTQRWLDEARAMSNVGRISTWRTNASLRPLVEGRQRRDRSAIPESVSVPARPHRSAPDARADDEVVAAAIATADGIRPSAATAVPRRS